jgi:hypothetical protein
MAKSELTYTRDLSFSLFHRKLESNCYMQDIDKFLWMLYDKQFMPLALIEEKNSNIQEIDLNSPQLKALRNLAKPHKIPVFVLITHKTITPHNQEYLTFYVKAANKEATKFLNKLIKKDYCYLSELDYARFEGHLRNQTVPLTVVDKTCILKDKFPIPEFKELTS